MTPDEAEWLRRAWADRACLHPRLVREIIADESTDDFYCEQCGKHFFADEAEKLLARRSSE